MMEITTKCSFGTCLNEDCHLTNFTNEKSLLKLDELEQSNIEILLLRTSNVSKALNDIKEKYICGHHKAKLLDYYSSGQRKCVDPYSSHSTVIRKGLKEITLNFSKQIKHACHQDILPGEKVCVNCFAKLQSDVLEYEKKMNQCINPHQKHRSEISDNLTFINKDIIEHLKVAVNLIFSEQHKICDVCRRKIESDILESSTKEKIVNSELVLDNRETVSSNETNSSSVTNESTPDIMFESASQKKRNLDEILDTFNMPPFKRLKLNNDRLIKVGIGIVQHVSDKVSRAFEEANNVKLPSLNFDQLYSESSWFNAMITNVKSKYDKCINFNEKVSTLTILPEECDFELVNKYFNCSYYIYREAKKMRKNNGILCQRIRKTYLRVSELIRNEIVNYYLKDSNSINCSGMKEFVTIKDSDGSSTDYKKLILLYDLKELYNKWIKDSGREIVPSLAFFCQMRPKQCVFAGQPGTHNICICSEHQNIKLKVSAIQPNMNYKELIEAGVCSIDNKKCMLHECDQCPGTDGIRQFLCSDVEIDGKKNIEYSNWSSVSVANQNSETSWSSRVTLVNFFEPMNKFVDKLSEDVWNLTSHQFISYNQKEYFHQIKDKLNINTGLLIMDFAENYSFICQNSTQGFYFNNTQATLFTVAFYYKDPTASLLKCVEFCVISDSTVHQAYSVHMFMETVIQTIKIEFPWITNLIYFSDGAPTQFKNKNHFINLCHHEKDFGIKIESYNFFATSHGKSACDGIGATAKRTARKASLQKIQILNAKQMYEHLSKKKTDIRYLYVEHAKVLARGKMLAKRFDSAKTVKNTRTYHYVRPIDEQTLEVKLYSFDTESSIVKI